MKLHASEGTVEDSVRVDAPAVVKRSFVAELGLAEGYYLLDVIASMRGHDAAAFRAAIVEGPFTGEQSALEAAADWNIAGDLIVVQVMPRLDGSSK